MFTPIRYRKNDFGFDDFFNDFAWPVWGEDKGPKMPKMKTDIKETDDSYELTIDIPGFKKEDVKAQLKDGYLTITATKQDETKEDDEKTKFIHRERFFGTMTRSFYVGDNLTEEDIKAKFADGTLNLTVPKNKQKEVAEEKFIAIEG